MKWHSSFGHLLRGVTHKIFSLLYDDLNMGSPNDFRCNVCCSINNPVEENECEIVNKNIPAGKCALVRYIGSDDSIGSTVNYLYSEWLSNSSYKLRDFLIFLKG